MKRLMMVRAFSMVHCAAEWCAAASMGTWNVDGGSHVVVRQSFPPAYTAWASLLKQVMRMSTTGFASWASTQSSHVKRLCGCTAPEASTCPSLS